MNQRPPISPALLARYYPRMTTASAPREGLTLYGFMLFVMGVLVALSAFTALRVQVGNLYVHPYLLAIAPFVVWMFVTNLRSFPTLPLWLLVVFCALYSFSTLVGGGLAPEEITKVIATAATTVTVALMVRSQADFRAGVLGLNLAIGFLALATLRTQDAEISNALDIANKNAFSLYALPAMLVGGFVLLDRQHRAHPLSRALIIGAIFAASIVIVLSGNRSGWLGLSIVALLLLASRMSLSTLVFLMMGLAALYVAVTQFNSTKEVERRWQQTLEGTASDVRRVDLVRVCWQIGLDNPVLGVSPEALPFVIARELGISTASEAHNLYAHIWAGSGIFCTLALLLTGTAFFYIQPPRRLQPDELTEWRRRRQLTRMMIVLFAIRAVFTHEILYSPGFALAMGFAVGLAGLNARKPFGASSFVFPTPWAALMHGAPRPPRWIPTRA